MLKAFKGRINRRTYIVGNLMAVGFLAVAVFLIVIPIALLQLLLDGRTGSDLLPLFYVLSAIPAILYYLYAIVLLIRRTHDIGFPGIILAACFTGLLVFGRLFDLNILNVLGILIILTLAVVPGQSKKNSFGPKPRKKLSKNKLKVHLD